MNCPQCNKEMKYKCNQYSSFSSGDEPDYDLLFIIESYKCKDCKIVCKIDNSNPIPKIDWIVPDEYLPTERQLNTIEFINKYLGLEEICPTKKSAWKFINQNLNQAVIQRNTNFANFCEDNQDWLIEYF